MTKIRRLVWGIAIGVTGTATLLGLLAWQILRPKIRTATPEQVLALVPADLLVSQRDDPAAKERFRLTLPLICKTQWYRWPTLSFDHQMTNQSSTFNLKSAQDLLKTSDLWKLSNILDSGKIQFDSSPANTSGNGFGAYYSSVSLLARACTEGAMLLEKAGDTNGSLRLLTFSILLFNRYATACDSMTTYMHMPDRGNLIRAIQTVASDSRFPASSCRTLLNLLPNATVADDNLIEMLRIDFQNYTLKMLPNPIAWHVLHPRWDTAGLDEFRRVPDELYGTYDALEATKKIVKAMEVLMANAKRPYSEYDTTADAMVIEAKSHLPAPTYGRMPMEMMHAMEQWRTVNAVAAHPDFIEAHMVAWLQRPLFDFYMSFSSRLEQNATRILLASRVYRSEHNNNLPTDPKSLLPYLDNKWPVDPYTGGPMFYDTDTQKVFLSAMRMTNDGSKFTVIPASRASKGLSLELK